MFDDYVASFGLSQRLAFQACDFWAEEMPRTDVLALGRIMHDWDRREDNAAPEGLRGVARRRRVDRPGDANHDERRENAFRLLMSLNMLIETPGGFDFTGADCQEWMRTVGFRETWVEPLAGPEAMVVGIKWVTQSTA